MTTTVADTTPPPVARGLHRTLWVLQGFLGVFFIVVCSPVNVLVILAADRLASWLQANPKVLRGIDYTFAGVFSIFAFKIFMTQTR